MLFRNVLLKQQSYARDNEESESIPTSLMTEKENIKRRSMLTISWNFQQGRDQHRCRATNLHLVPVSNKMNCSCIDLCLCLSFSSLAVAPCLIDHLFY